MREKIIDSIIENGIIAIVRGQSRDNIFKIADALLKGGVKLMEITYNAAKPETNGETAETIHLLKEKFGNEMYVGAGTVLTEKQVILTHEAGGQYIISPNVSEGVIRKTVELGMVSIPGALTPTECQAAHEYGADFVKIFPTVSVGSSYIKAISAPLSHIRFLAVGGVSPENLGEFMKAGALGTGAGGDLILKSAIESGDFSLITERARQYATAFKKAKESI